MTISLYLIIFNRDVLSSEETFQINVYFNCVGPNQKTARLLEGVR